MGKMTEKEIKIIELLMEVYDAYSDLDEQHKDDKAEFINALHILQHLVMIRSVRRKNPELFPVNKNNIDIISSDPALTEILSTEIKNEINKRIGNE